MSVMFGLMAMEFLLFGILLDDFLSKVGTYELAIDAFNSILPYVLAVDFAVKFFLKPGRSMQIAPYLCLPLKRKRIFDVLLMKELSSIWNLYPLFLVVPFAFKAITPFFGIGAPFLYILFFYLLCVTNSLLVNLFNNLGKINFLYYIPAIAVIAFPFALAGLFHLNPGDYTQQLGESLLNHNPLVWAVLIIFLVAFWRINRRQLRSEIYRELQGEKIEKISAFSSLSFLEHFGELGSFINLELKMIFRAKRLKSQFFALILLLPFFIWQIYLPFRLNFFSLFFFGIITVSAMGVSMGQYLFMAESSYFDGLMSRKLSILKLLKGKYFLYSSHSLITAIILLIPALSGKLDLLFVVSLFFFSTGPIFFLIFQNAVYNKTYLNLFEGGMMNWKGTSSNMLTVTMMTMFAPAITLVIINALFGQEATYWVMLLTGIGFTLTSQRWLEWTYNRFLKRKYKNMEGFRSNV
jgi:hypothetical protein